VNIPSYQPPPVPSEHLLNYFNRNDLRWGIAQMGGRVNVSYLLGAKIIPGKWKEAIELEEVKQLLPCMKELGPERSKRKERKMNNEKRTVQNRQGNMTRQSHGDIDQQQGEEESTQTTFTNIQRVNLNSTTNATLMSLVSSAAPSHSTKGQTNEFWSKEKAVKKLYQYLESYRKYRQRPAVWMPQLAEISHEGCSSLFNACSRFEKLPSSINNDDDIINSFSGLVPFREWRFFESQLQLFVELQHYLRLYHNESEDFFPEPSNVLMHGHTQLHDLIRIHGGKTMLAQKLDMKFAWDINHLTTENATVFDRSLISTRSTYNPNLSWGSFTLKFAIQLLHFIRSQYLSLNPPLSSSYISMPSEKDLICCGHEELATKVVLFGGYENVARRLGLEYFDGKSQQMEERRFRAAKLLWKDRNNNSREDMSKRKRKGLAWNEDIVIRELHAYVKVNMTKRSLPPTVMPRFRQLDEDGRGDLKRAISKFGGGEYICSKANLIPIEVWQSSCDRDDRTPN